MSAPPLPAGKNLPLHTLHAAIDTHTLWKGVLHLLRSHFTCKRVTLFLGHMGMGEARVVFTDPQIDHSSEWYAKRGKLNPFSPWIERNPGIDHYIFSTITGPPAEFRKSSFYQQFAKLEGWDKGMSGLLWHEGELLAMFSLYRGPRQPDFSDSDVAILRSLLPEIRVAVERVQRINQDQERRKALEGFLRNVPVPIMLLDWEKKLIFANRTAMDSVAIWNFGHEKARQFNSRDCFKVPSAILRVVQALRDEILTIEPKSLSKSLPITKEIFLPGDPTRKARISAAHYGQDSLARPGFFVLLIDPPAVGSVPSAELPANLKDWQMLSPAEREITKLVCQGLSNTEIATQLNKSLLTVKTQLNSVFQKLGVESRTKLIARLHQP
ncbi:MAG: helix-turn-helix transcriptional regulator [Verrucomicrobia bacterium]|nr:helix-turn-helix transcriptional regulator [Verrucomicrobiota bacterium]